MQVMVKETGDRASDMGTPCMSAIPCASPTSSKADLHYSSFTRAAGSISKTNKIPVGTVLMNPAGNNNNSNALINE